MGEETASTLRESKFVPGYKNYVLEKRKLDGTLDFSPPYVPQHLFYEATEDQLCDYFFAHSGHGDESASQEKIAEWYASQGFYYRVKTW